MKLIMTVLGAKKFNDTIEGQKHDFTKLVVAMDMPETENAAGQNAVEMRWGTHENFSSIKTVAFPAQFELDVNPTTKGFEIISAKPVAASVKAVG